MKWNKLFEYIPIESEILKYQAEYYSAIAESNNAGNSNVFIEFMLKMIDKTMGEVLKDTNQESKNISE